MALPDLEDQVDLVVQEDKVAQGGLEAQVHLDNPVTQGVPKVLEVQGDQEGLQDLVDQEDPKDPLCPEGQEDQKARGGLEVLEALGDL